jgi:hypothetical protein
MAVKGAMVAVPIGGGLHPGTGKPDVAQSGGFPGLLVDLPAGLRSLKSRAQGLT